MADAGRVIAGSARRRCASQAPGAGTRPFGDRVKQTLFAILEPDLRGRARCSTCSPAAARPGSRRCRGARPRRLRREGRRRRPRHRGEPAAGRGLARPGARDPRRTRSGGWPRGRGRRTRSTSSSLDPPYDAPALLDRALGGARAARRARARRPRRREALLERPPPAADGAASIGPRAPVRRDRAHLLPRGGIGRGGVVSVAVYPGSFDPITNGHLDVVRRACARLRPGGRGGAREPAQDSRCSRPTSASRRSARRSAKRGLDGGASRSTSFDGLTVDFCRARRRRRSSSAACARSATSRPRCSSRTTTASSRRASTRSSS